MRLKSLRCLATLIVLLCFVGPCWGAGGIPLWLDLFDNGGGDNVANAIVAQGGRVFAVGGGTTETESFQWVIRAYNAKSGNLLWDGQAYGGSKRVELFLEDGR